MSRPQLPDVLTEEGFVLLPQISQQPRRNNYLVGSVQVGKLPKRDQALAQSHSLASRRQ